MARTMLVSNMDFYVNPSGSDATGDGSAGNPWASPQGAYTHLQANYDLTGHLVNVYCADGLYTTSNQFTGLLVGQAGAGSLKFIGNYSNPFACQIRPDPVLRGYAFSVDKGAQCTIGGFYMNMLGADGMAIGQDTTAVGQYSIMIWDDKLVFGPNINPWNHCSVNGTLLINSGEPGTPKGYLIAPGLQYRTWSSSGPTTWLTVSNLSGIRIYQGVNGNYQHPEAHVVAIDAPNSRVQISHATSNSGPVSNQGVNFSNGAQCHILAGQGGRAQFVTNGEPNRARVEIHHLPYFYYAYLGAYQLSVIDYPAVQIVYGAAGRRYDVRQNSVISCQANNVPEGGSENVLPGTLDGFKNNGGIYV